MKKAAERETEEEAGIKPKEIKRRGILNFEFKGNPEILEVHLFSVFDFYGQLIETEEMRPQWFAKKEIPYLEMWQDDKYWLPLLLAGKNFEGNFYFQNNNTLISQNIKEVKDF